MVVVRAVSALLPVMVMVDVPDTAVAPTVRVRVVVHVGLGVQEGWEKLGVTPLGTPLTTKPTARGVPKTSMAVIVVVPDAPGVTVRVVGFAASE